MQRGAPRPDKRAAAVALVEAARSGSARFRKHERSFLHSKTYLLDSTDGALVVVAGSANLTGGGLYANLEQIEVDATSQVRARARCGAATLSTGWYGR